MLMVVSNAEEYQHPNACQLFILYFSPIKKGPGVGQSPKRKERDRWLWRRVASVWLDCRGEWREFIKVNFHTS